MPIPQSYALVFTRGDSARWQFRLWADAAKTVAVDLTGVVAAAAIRPSSGALVPLTCSVEGAVVTVSVTAIVSQRVAEVGTWDLQLTYPSGDVQTIVTGTVYVHADITGSGVMPGRREMAHV